MLHYKVLGAALERAEGEDIDNIWMTDGVDRLGLCDETLCNIRFVGEFPMTVTGKVQKYLIRDSMAEELEHKKTA